MSNEDGFDGLVTHGERERELQVDAGTDEIRRGGIFVEVVEKDERGDSSVRDVKRGQDESRDEDCEVGRGEEEFDDGGGTSEKRERRYRFWRQDAFKGSSEAIIAVVVIFVSFCNDVDSQRW